MNRNQGTLLGAGALVLASLAMLAGVYLGKASARHEPETWCAKRLFSDFYLTGEKLDAVAYSDEETNAYAKLTCNYERNLRKHEPDRAEVRKK